MDNDKKEETTRVDTASVGNRDPKMNFPSNSHKSREQQKEESKKVQKVVKGAVVQKKKSAGKRFLENFVSEDMPNIFGYILHEVLIPAAKSTLEDMVKGGIEMLLHGESKGSSRSSRDRGRSYVSYNNYSRRDDRDRDRDRDRRDLSYRDRSRHNFDELIFETRADAEEVIDRLMDLIDEYGQATVANLYDLVGITEEFTDHKYGWTNLRSAHPTRVRDGGYQLNLPRPILLD
jgi:hypothetical protein